MTAWQVYWIMQADRFVNLFIGLGIAGAVAMLLAVAIYVPPEASTKEKYTKYIRRWVWAELGLLVFTVKPRGTTVYRKGIRRIERAPPRSLNRRPRG